MSRWSVLGSGVAGLCVATLLMERGETVELLIQGYYGEVARKLSGGTED